MDNNRLLVEWCEAFLSFLFPRCCVVCGNPLARSEEILCSSCNADLPRTAYHLVSNNLVEQLFWGKVPIERASSYFFYRKGSRFKRILHSLKYHGGKEVGVYMGRCMAAELMSSGFFNEIDYVIPLPLHAKKLRLRGYNQSDCIARGIQSVTSIPLDVGSVVRVKHTESQTHKSMYERWENVKDIFELRNAVHLTGKHLLVVDDVLTTGATLIACIAALNELDGVKISVLTLAVAE